MSIPQLTLLGFAAWTLFVLMATVGVHRWSRVLSGHSRMNEFPPDAPTGPGWCRRATRARAVSVRFTFFTVQVVAMGVMLALLVR